jgi:hypothetical protein
VNRPRSEPNEALVRIRAAGERVGLCSRCAHVGAAVSPRSVFVRCGLAATDERFQRYPTLPVLACPGFEAVR